MTGKYFRRGKKWIVSYKDTGTKQVIEEEVPPQVKTNLKQLPQPQMEGVEVQVEFELTKKKGVDFTTLKLLRTVQTVPTQSSSVPSGLPMPFIDLNRSFFSLSEERRRAVLQAIEFRKDLQKSDVELLLKAAAQDFPLAFKSTGEFKDALLKLVQRTSKFNQLKFLNSFQKGDTPAVIMIHGSSVAGLRGKKKEQGWGFGKDSDIDISIVDVTRFCWAQALGITTFSDCNTIELNDSQLHLLKLYNFAEGFRKILRQRQVNFMVYAAEQKAAKHSGFTLVCHFDSSTTDFKITKIYNEEFIEQAVPDSKCGKKLLVQRFFESERAEPEQLATIAILDGLSKPQTKPPGQGNHIFNDLPSELVFFAGNLKDFLDRKNLPPRPAAEFIRKYTYLLKNCAAKLERLSRDAQTAQRIHVQHKDAIMKGFDIVSDNTNELLFGNALLYFRNASQIVCEAALLSSDSLTRVPALVPALKKSFSNLLDSIVDEPLLKKLKSSNPLQNYAKSEATNYKDLLRDQVNRYFKIELDFLVKGLSFENYISTIELATLSPDEWEWLFDHDPEHEWALLHQAEFK